MRRITITLVAAGYLSASPVGEAGVIGPVELSPAVARVQAYCFLAGGQSYWTWTGYASAYSACNLAGTYVVGSSSEFSGYGETGVIVNSTFGPKMQVDVMAYATSTGDLGEDGAYVAAAWGVGSIEYYFALEQVAETPVPVSSVPVTYSFWGSATGYGWEYYSWYYSALGGFLEGAYSLSLNPGRVYSDALSAGCYSYGRNWGGYGYAECQAIADPIFEFDQAAFDKQMGAQTFELARYFAFSFSPNLVPEPDSLALLGLGLTGLGLTRRRLAS